MKKIYSGELEKKTELTVDGLNKSFGRRPVLAGVSFSISPGEVVGFVGPNGAGKSTTMKIMLGLVHANSGDVHLDSVYLSKDRAAYLQNVAGFVDGPPQYPILSARDHMRYVARLRGVLNVDDVLGKVGLSSHSRKPVSRFSMGMKQRVAIGMALLQAPKFLLLDEPANGLDPAAMIEFRELIRSLADDSGIGVLISSHILGEIERVCDRVVFIRAGQIVKEVGMRLNAPQTTFTLRTTDDRRAAAVLDHCSGVDNVQVRQGSLFISVDKDSVIEIAKVLVSDGIGLLELSPARDLLEADYLSEFHAKEMLS